MSNALEATDKEYGWKDDGTDGLRSYSTAASNSSWNYAIISNPDKAENERYTFTDSSTGQPSARRGNLYNMTAATLGSSLGLSTRGEQAPDSLCPRGWQLPVATTDSSASVETLANRSTAKLLRTYGIPDGTDTTSVNRLREWPLEYLPTGYYNYSNGVVSLRTTRGLWWSGAVTSAALGFYLHAWDDSTYVQDNWSRGLGMALRCVESTTSSIPLTLGTFSELC